MSRTLPFNSITFDLFQLCDTCLLHCLLHDSVSIFAGVVQIDSDHADGSVRSGWHGDRYVTDQCHILYAHEHNGTRLGSHHVKTAM